MSTQEQTIDWDKVPRERILIAIPTLSGMISVPLANFIGQAIATSFRPGPWTFDVTLIPERWPHFYARNLAVKNFLASNADRLWFIDDDMLPTASSWNMLLHDADIVSGIYYCLKKAEDDASYQVQSLLFQKTEDGKMFTPDYPKSLDDLVHPVEAAGAGCLLIKRHVLEDRRMWLPTKYTTAHGEERDYLDEKDDEKWAPPLFRHLWKPGGNELRSEDIDFCNRARGLGFSMLGDHSAHFGHLKRADVNMIAQSLAKAVQEGIKQGAESPAIEEVA